MISHKVNHFISSKNVTKDAGVIQKRNNWISKSISKANHTGHHKTVEFLLRLDLSNSLALDPDRVACFIRLAKVCINSPAISYTVIFVKCLAFCVKS